MHIQGKHYLTTTQYIKECMDNGEDIEYIIDGLNDVGISRHRALVMIEYTEEERK